MIAAIAGISALRFVFGPFSLQGLLFVLVTGVATWQVGLSAGLLSAVLGLASAHLLRFALNPGRGSDPAVFLTPQYAMAVGTYLALSGAAILIGRRHRVTVERLEEVERDRMVELDQARDLAAIVEWSDDAIVASDLSSTITSWNRAASTMFGFTAHEAIGQSIYRLLPPERHQEERDLLEKIRRGDAVVHFETVRLRKDGTPVDISLTVSPIRDQRGQVVGASRIARDITRRREALAAIDDLQKRLVALTAASGALLRSPQVADVVPAVLSVARDLLAADAYAVWQLQPERGAWQTVASSGLSEGFARTTVPVAPESLLREPVAVPDAEAAPILESRREAYAAERIRSMLVVPMLNNGQTAAAAVLYYRSRHTFSELEMQAARALGHLASAALTTAELYDQQRRSRVRSEFLAEAGIRLANSLDATASLREVAGLAVPYFADFCAVDLVDEAGTLRCLLVAHVDSDKKRLAEAYASTYRESAAVTWSAEHVVRTREPVLIERFGDEQLRAHVRDRRQRDAIKALDIRSLMVVPMVARERGVGAMTFAVGSSGRGYSSEDLRFAMSIASRAALAVDNARAYAEARAADRLKDQFLATLSHELRTPLNAVLGYARMANSGMFEGDRLVKALRTLERNAMVLTRLVEDVLDVSRLVSGKVVLQLQPVILRAVVDEALASIRPAAEAKGLRLRVESDAALRVIRGDSGRLQQIVWNLLSNAVKFTSPGGEVHVTVTSAGVDAEVIVRDTGCGIAPDFLPHVFDRFRQGDGRFSREHGGLGLGLAIARDLAEMQGGRISASSDGPGRGSTFRLVLPLVTAGAGDGTAVGHAPGEQAAGQQTPGEQAAGGAAAAVSPP
ncbi:MAG: ATP-binding protein [Vicinamibacterales bacterium]